MISADRIEPTYFGLITTVRAAMRMAALMNDNGGCANQPRWPDVWEDDEE